MEIEKTFEVLAGKRAAFETQMTRLGRKAAKLGVEAPSYTMGPAEFIERTFVTYEGKKYKAMVEIFRVTVTPVVVKLPGWEFLATLEHLEGGETLLRALVESVPAKYRTAPPTCDHCQLARKRSDTYLVKSTETGEVKQVGRACLADFTGHDNPEHLAQLAEYAASVNGCDEDGWGAGESTEEIAPVLEFLTVATSLARTVGYKSKKMVEEQKASMTTAHTVMEVLFPHGNFWKKEAPVILAAVTDADRAKAQASLDWILGLEGELSDFLHNVRAVVKTGAVKRRTAGYAAALTVSYAKEMDQLRERAERPVSKHQGEVGKREVFTLTVGKIIAIEGHYGVTHLHLMTDAQGNDFKWFGASEIGAEGETVTMKATVKGHEEYKGRAQTMLSRCAVFVPKEPKAKRARAKAAPSP